LSRFKSLADTGNYPGKEEISKALGVVRPLLACDESDKIIERFNLKKDDLLDLSETYHNLEQFYEHQKPTWEKLLSSYQRFQMNSLELERNERAAPALKRMHEILNAPAPYGIIHEAEGLIHTVGEVNTGLITRRRAEVIAKVDEHIAEITNGLDAAKGDEALRSKCLGPVKRLRQQVEQMDSIAHLAQAEQEAVKAIDASMTEIEKFVRQTPSGEKDTLKPKVKPRCIIKPTELVGATYLETQDDIEKFLDELKKKLKEAIDSGKRIQIR